MEGIVKHDKIFVKKSTGEVIGSVNEIMHWKEKFEWYFYGHKIMGFSKSSSIIQCSCFFLPGMKTF